MVILPTGLGKTAIALLVAASRLYNEGGRVLMLAPTKPLVEQHLRFFEKFLIAKSPAGSEESPFAMFTGDAPPAERTADWERAQVIFATPQVVKNDLIAGRYTLRDVTLLIVDECHRAVGNYAYVFLARRYHDTADKPLLLAMTASPGGTGESPGCMRKPRHRPDREQDRERPGCQPLCLRARHRNIPDRSARRTQGIHPYYSYPYR